MVRGGAERGAAEQWREAGRCPRRTPHPRGSPSLLVTVATVTTDRGSGMGVGVRI
jgi:hypothetical protein